MVQAQREYECIVFGATGYTGKYTAEHIATHLPIDFEWAIAGRSESKLKALAGELKSLNSDRAQPRIELAQLNKTDLSRLARKTKVLISAVGPYHRYGTAAFEACAEAGTHYLDCTGEVPWVHDMNNKYGALAKKTGAIMIPQNGAESAPTDLMCWMLVTHIRQTLSAGTAELINVIHQVDFTPSGGTLDTALTLFDSYGLIQILKAMSPFSLLPSGTPRPNQLRRKPILEVLTGIRTHQDLGILTDSIQGPTDAPIIYRSWNLIGGGQYYGPNFQLSSYMRTKTKISAFITHLALNFGMAALIFPPVRWLLKRVVYQPGEGPSREQAQKESCEWRAIAKADQNVSDPHHPHRAFGRIRWDGSLYDLTGTFLAEAAVCIARDTTFAHEQGGGLLTPASLGASYLERLQKAGLKTEVKTLPQ